MNVHMSELTLVFPYLLLRKGLALFSWWCCLFMVMTNCQELRGTPIFHWSFYPDRTQRCRTTAVPYPCQLDTDLLHLPRPKPSCLKQSISWHEHCRLCPSPLRISLCAIIGHSVMSMPVTQHKSYPNSWDNAGMSYTCLLTDFFKLHWILIYTSLCLYPLLPSVLQLSLSCV